MSTTKELEQYGRFLRNAAPQEFENFKVAFARYTEATVHDMLSMTGELHTAQGRAQQCVKILRVLEELKNG